MNRRKEYSYGIDLLRIVAMFMIVVLHILGPGGILENTNLLSINYNIGWFLEIASYCSVNCYALISGYVGRNAEYKYKNIILLWLRVLFYTLLITMLFAVFSREKVGGQEVINAIFPVMRKQYWYFTQYFCMFFLIPIVNYGINSIEIRKLHVIIGTNIVIFSVLPTIIREDIFHLENGYSAYWLLILYIIGAYIDRIELSKRITRIQALLGYVSMVIITWLSKIGIEWVTYRLCGEPKGRLLLVNYTSPTILMASIFLIILFSEINVKGIFKKIVLFFAPSAFSVYLIHTNKLIWKNWWIDLFVNVASMPPVIFVIIVIVSAVVVYCVCSFIDKGRIRIFSILKINQRIDYLGKYLCKLYGKSVKENGI